MRSCRSRVFGTAAACAGLLILAASHAAADDPCAPVTVGIDVFPVAAAENQPSPIGDFRGHLGYSLFSAEGGPADNWVHFEADMRFVQGKLLDTCGAKQIGQWGLT